MSQVKFILIGMLSLFIMGCTELEIDSVSSTQAPEIDEIIDRTQTLQFRFEVQNTSMEVLREQAIYVAIPVQQSPRHKLTAINVNQKYKKMIDEIGNQLLVFKFDTLKPLMSKIITIESKLVAEENAIGFEQDRMRYLLDDEKLNLSHPLLIVQAEKLKGESTKQTIENVYQWVIKYMNYTGYIGDERGALYAYNNQSGDCTEYMYLLASMLRINDIPARLVAGYVYDGNAIVNPNDYHNWVEVWVGNKWVVVDAQKERYGEEESMADYISMRYLDFKQDHFDNSQRFKASKNVRITSF